MSFNWPGKRGPKRRGHLVAVQTLKVTVCDKCGSDRGDTQRWGISFPGNGRRTFDLCPGCSEPLAEYEGLLERVGSSGPKRHVQPVLSTEEAEARVRRAKRTRRKPQNKG